MTIRPIQYLRGIAAMMVVWHHALSQLPHTRDFIHVPEFGPYGVDLFFMISGFIMLVTTWDKDLRPGEFMVRRVQRIVPLYWAATLLMVGVAIVAPHLLQSLQWDDASLVKSLLFVPYDSLSFPGHAWPLLVPGWSLNYEMFFYLLFALTLFARREWRLPLMAGALGCLVLAGWLAGVSTTASTVYTSPRLLEFGAGMALGRLWLALPPVTLGWESKTLLALGDASYSIYLSHLFTLGVVRMVWAHAVHVTTLTTSIAFMVFALAVCAVAGCVCYRWVEQPITRWAQKAGSRKNFARSPVR